MMPCQANLLCPGRRRHGRWAKLRLDVDEMYVRLRAVPTGRPVKDSCAWRNQPEYRTALAHRLPLHAAREQPAHEVPLH